MIFKRPTTNQVFAITAAPAWPNIVFETDASGPHTWTWTIAWGAFTRTGKVTTTGNTWDAQSAISNLGGTLTVFIIKQLKGAGVHALGAKSHNLYPQHTLEHADVQQGLQRRALPRAAWQIVRDNFRRAGGGPAAQRAVTESVLKLAALSALPYQDLALGES